MVLTNSETPSLGNGRYYVRWSTAFLLPKGLCRDVLATCLTKTIFSPGSVTVRTKGDTSTQLAISYEKNTWSANTFKGPIWRAIADAHEGKMLCITPDKQCKIRFTKCHKLQCFCSAILTTVCHLQPQYLCTCMLCGSLNPNPKLSQTMILGVMYAAPGVFFFRKFLRTSFRAVSHWSCYAFYNLDSSRPVGFKAPRALTVTVTIASMTL